MRVWAARRHEPCFRIKQATWSVSRLYLRLPCIHEIAVIRADVRDDQQFDDVPRRAGGDERVPGHAGVETCIAGSRGHEGSAAS
jgi:hypothetical protein